jgi:hypothetical protein
MKPGPNYLRAMARYYHTGVPSIPPPSTFTADERAAVVEKLNATVFSARSLRLYPCDISGELEVSFGDSGAATPTAVDVRLLFHVETIVYL